MPAFRSLLMCAVATAALMFGSAGRVYAQFNAAYENGYKPMLDLSGKLKDLGDSADKRLDFGAVRDVGSSYRDRLEKVIAAMEGAGRNMKDGSNQVWIRSTCSPVLAAAKEAKGKADKLYDKGDRKEDCRGEVINLQESLAKLSDEFKKCWREHEDQQRKLIDEYGAVRQKWWDATKEDRKPVEELGKKANEAREKANEQQARATEAGKLYMAAQDQCDKARSELFSSDVSRSPDEINSKYEAWGKAEDLVKRVDEAAKSANKSAADAAKNYSEALAAWEKASEQYTREAREGDDLYKIVKGRHQKAFEMSQEYKPFSF